MRGSAVIVELDSRAEIAMPMLKIDELDVAHVSNEQAAAIGRLTLSFNFIEACLNEAIKYLFNPREAVEIGVLVARMTFQEKVDRLDALVKSLAGSLGMPTEVSADSSQIDRWAAESLTEWPSILKRLRQSAQYRNGLIHCTVALSMMDEEPSPRLVSKSGAELLSSDAESISREARRFGALGLELVIFGQQLHDSVRNFRRRIQEEKGKTASAE